MDALSLIIVFIAGLAAGIVITMGAVGYFSGVFDEDLSGPHDHWD